MSCKSIIGSVTCPSKSAKFACTERSEGEKKLKVEQMEGGTGGGWCHWASYLISDTVMELILTAY